MILVENLGIPGIQEGNRSRVQLQCGRWMVGELEMISDGGWERMR